MQFFCNAAQSYFKLRSEGRGFTQSMTTTTEQRLLLFKKRGRCDQLQLGRESKVCVLVLGVSKPFRLRPRG